MASDRALAVVKWLRDNENWRQFVAVPFPMLDDGGWITYMQLPTDLTEGEAERLKAMIDAWVVPVEVIDKALEGR